MTGAPASPQRSWAYWREPSVWRIKKLEKEDKEKEIRLEKQLAKAEAKAAKADLKAAKAEAKAAKAAAKAAKKAK